MDLSISLFESPYYWPKKDTWVYPKQPKTISTTWTSLIKSLTRYQKTPDKRLSRLWSPARFKEGETRKATNVVDVSCLVWDFDDGISWQKAARPWSDFNHVIHASYSHTEEHHKFRIVIPFERPVTAADWSVVWKVSHKRALSCGESPDVKCSDPSRMYYVPTCPLDSDCHFTHVNHTGEWYTVTASEKVKARKPIAQPAVSWKARQRLNKGRANYRADTQARLDLAQRLGAQIDANRAHKIKCPKCNAQSVWYLLNPETRYTASCNHQNSCGWFGPLDELQ